MCSTCWPSRHDLQTVHHCVCGCDPSPSNTVPYITERTSQQLTGEAGHRFCLTLMQAEVRSNLVTATAASSLISCFIMGAFANMPLALAPGMGLNAYFAYNVVGYAGTGDVSIRCLFMPLASQLLRL